MSTQTSRSIRLSSRSGIDISVLPSRGLDLGEMSFLANRIGLDSIDDDFETPMDSAGRIRDWIDVFGGMMLTCGLANVGQPSEGRGLHGRYSLIAATDITVEQDQTSIRVRGNVLDESFFCVRTVELYHASARVSVSDEVTNVGVVSAQSPVLYHVNFGAFLFSAGARVDGGGIRTSRLQDGTVVEPSLWSHPFDAPVETEVVIEHEFNQPAIAVSNDHAGVRAFITWTGLERLHQWVDPVRQVLSIEPANCSVLGREHDRLAGDAPFLRPGERRRTSIEIEMSSI